MDGTACVAMPTTLGKGASLAHPSTFLGLHPQPHGIRQQSLSWLPLEREVKADVGPRLGVR